MTDPLTRAWVALIALGLATTALAARGPEAGTPWLGALILAIAFLKMRLILTRYLGLATPPSGAAASTPPSASSCCSCSGST